MRLVHGADDDVIPYEQAYTLAKGLPREALRGLHVTGLYGHAQQAGVRLADVRAMGREVWTLLKILRAVAGCGAG